MRHRLPLALMFAAALFGAAATIGHAQDAGKVLRIALPDITSLDPQQLSDLYSRRVADAIFEGLYQFDYLASPAKVIPNTAAALPVITDGGRTWTIALQRGIHFAPDPVFKANPRELVAADYVYAIKRLLDPGLKTGGDPALTDLIEGARPVVDAARKNGRFDYDAAIEGLRATDTHTLRIRLTAVDYTMLERLALINTYAVAREAVEAAGPDVLSRPVGTGPFRLAEWRRGSRVVLEANPGYRKIAFPAHAEPAHRALVAAMQGRRLPALQRIEISIIEEQIPGAGLEQGSLDYTTLTGTIVGRLAENGRLRPDLAKRGVGYLRYPVPALIFTYFNQDDPVVGGNAPARIALRRAIAMGFDNAGFIRTFYGGHRANRQPVAPARGGWADPKLLPSRCTIRQRRALLERFGYRDRDGDGFREAPDGSPLTLVQNSPPSAMDREADTLWVASMKAIGLRVTINNQSFSDLLKASKAGQLMMFNLGNRAGAPSGYTLLSLLWGKSPPDTNPSRFRNADYDAAYEKFLQTRDGPERVALARKMSGIVNAFVPFMIQVYPIGNAFTQPWLLGYHPSPFGFGWKYLDIDLAKKRAAGK
ncbi:MAG: bicyclomycin resistance protein [Betaproteobacteria bacterium]|nr:bicyclomycin resistance protein [Betaproteobacteria bacterium]